MPIGDFRHLVVWDRSIALAVSIYGITRRFPPDERFGLTAQLRRAVVSISANIAEGNGRVHRRDYAYHVSIARGSLREVQSLIEVALRLGYVKDEELTEIRELFDHIGRMLTRLLKQLYR